MPTKELPRGRGLDPAKEERLHRLGLLSLRYASDAMTTAWRRRQHRHGPRQGTRRGAKGLGRLQNRVTRHKSGSAAIRDGFERGGSRLKGQIACLLRIKQWKSSVVSDSARCDLVRLLSSRCLSFQLLVGHCLLLPLVILFVRCVVAVTLLPDKLSKKLMVSLAVE